MNDAIIRVSLLNLNFPIFNRLLFSTSFDFVISIADISFFNALLRKQAVVFIELLFYSHKPFNNNIQ